MLAQDAIEIAQLQLLAVNGCFAAFAATGPMIASAPFGPVVGHTDAGSTAPRTPDLGDLGTSQPLTIAKLWHRYCGARPNVNSNRSLGKLIWCRCQLLTKGFPKAEAQGWPMVRQRRPALRQPPRFAGLASERPGLSGLQQRRERRAIGPPTSA